jgi:hypothetical protein
MDAATPDSNRRHPVGWAVLVLGLFLVATQVLDLGAQVVYSTRGVHASGTVIEYHKTSARSVSVTGQVNVQMPGTPPFKWEVDDTFGRLDWQDGGTVPLLCTRLHADHMSCVGDSFVDRYVVTLGLLVLGALLAWASVKMLRNRDTPVRPAVAEAPLHRP